MGSQTVLVVEDEQSIRELEQLIVEELFGVATIPAADGEEALRLALEHKPALIILDIMLPGMDGLEVARRLRADGCSRRVPIIAVTAAASRAEVLAAGCDDYLTKPFDLDLFAAKLTALLSRED